MENKKFTKGIWFNPRKERQPEFIIGQLSIQHETFLDWINTQNFDEKGYIRLDILMSKDNKPYLVVNEWKKQ